jgi:hypothetical protein
MLKDDKAFEQAEDHSVENSEKPQMKTLHGRYFRHAGWLGAALIASACGGGIGEVILAVVVTPLSGNWSDRVNNEDLQFIGLDPNQQLFSSKYPVQALVNSPVNFCDVADDGTDQLQLEGTYDNGKVVLYAKNSATKSTCIEGTITTLIKLDAPATGARPARSYVNSRVDVQLQLGLWASEDGSVRLKFSNFNSSSIDNNNIDVPIRACDVSPGATSADLDGLLSGYNTTTNAKPLIGALTPVGQTVARYSQIEFADGATLSLAKTAGQTVTLHRQREAAPTTCAAPPV